MNKYPPNTKERFFPVAEADSIVKNFSVRLVGDDVNVGVTFSIPDDFAGLAGVEVLVGSNYADAGVTTFKLDSSYGKTDQLLDENTESDYNVQTDLTGKWHKILLIPVDTVFTALEAGDLCGLKISHNTGGETGQLAYAGVRLRYLPKG